MRIYLVRHGETILNQKGCYYGRTDAVLSKQGIEQAEFLREVFREKKFDYVLSSPLVRAYNTAEIIIEGKENPIFCDSHLCEQDFGLFEGMTYVELKSRYPAELKEWNENYYAYRLPGGESFLDVRERTEAFYWQLKKLAETSGIESGAGSEAVGESETAGESKTAGESETAGESKAAGEGKTAGRDKSLLLVAHKGTLGHLLALMLGLPPEGYWNFVFEQGCYSRVDLEDGYAIIRKINAAEAERE